MAEVPAEFQQMVTDRFTVLGIEMATFASEMRCTGERLAASTTVEEALSALTRENDQ